METITSTQNPRIKALLELQEKSRVRREKGLFPVEGCREALHCIEAGYQVESLWHCPDILPQLPEGLLPGAQCGQAAAPSLVGRTDMPCGQAAHSSPSQPGCPVYTVSSNVYSRLAYREGTEGLIAVFREKHLTLEGLGRRLDKVVSPLVIVLESVEKPGNLGAVLRSADAAGADAVIVCDPLTDLYNPNLIRASIGAVFTVPVVPCTSQEAIAFLRGRGIAILTAQLQDSSLYYDTDMTGPTAIVMGTESTGLSTPWREAASAHIRIPMLGRLDSLNVSVSAAILLFEAVRQRQ